MTMWKEERPCKHCPVCLAKYHVSIPRVVDRWLKTQPTFFETMAAEPPEPWNESPEPIMSMLLTVAAHVWVVWGCDWTSITCTDPFVFMMPSVLFMTTLYLSNDAFAVHWGVETSLMHSLALASTVSFPIHVMGRWLVLFCTSLGSLFLLVQAKVHNNQ